jgi:hypothetical protein
MAAPMPPADLVSGALALVSLLPLGACVCPPRAPELVGTGFRTPQQTLRSFQAYFAADLEDWEYRCLSGAFKRRNELSLATYGEFRDQLLRESPWLKYFAKAEITGERHVREGVHVIEASVAGRTVHVRLLREDSYEIYRGETRLWDDYANFDELVEVEERPEGHRIVVAVPPADPGIDLREATAVHIERTWRIDDLQEALPTPEP